MSSARSKPVFDRKTVVSIFFIAGIVILSVILIFGVNWQSLQQNIPGAGNREIQILPSLDDPSNVAMPLTSFNWTDEGTTSALYIPTTMIFNGRDAFKVISKWTNIIKIKFDIGNAKAFNFSYTIVEQSNSRSTTDTSVCGFEFLDASGNLLFAHRIENAAANTSWLKWYSSTPGGRVTDMGGFTYYDRVRFDIRYDHGSVSITPEDFDGKFMPLVPSSFSISNIPVAFIQYHAIGLDDTLIYYDLSLTTHS